MNYTKSSYPELVDIKITDFCDIGCPFCYQGSTVKGKHASLDTINKIAYLLNDWKVFEVAIGGGEPTKHPEFLKILERFRGLNIVPNFTTKSEEWLDSPNFQDIMENVGNFAVSVQSVEELEQFRAHFTKVCKNTEFKKYNPRNFVVHYVMGSTSFDKFLEIIKACDWQQITLLGYKTNGRGNMFATIPYLSDLAHFLDKVDKDTDRESDCHAYISIDTALAQQLAAGQKQFDGRRYKPNQKLVTLEEGKFSCYIDAVQGLIGPSSYCDKKEMTQITNFDSSELIEIYRKY